MVKNVEMMVGAGVLRLKQYAGNLGVLGFV